jgi:hypothetical protein
MKQQPIKLITQNNQNNKKQPMKLPNNKLIERSCTLYLHIPLIKQQKRKLQKTQK